MRRRFDHLFRSVLCASAMALVACGGGNQKQESAAQPQASAPASSGSGASAPAAAVDAATAATVTGKVTFAGTPPPVQAVKLSSDPYCEKANPGLKTETEVVGSDGSIGNVFVYVKDGLGTRTFPTPSEPVV